MSRHEDVAGAGAAVPSVRRSTTVATRAERDLAEELGTSNEATELLREWLSNANLRSTGEQS